LVCFPSALKELKDRRPGSSRAKNIFITKRKESLLERMRNRTWKLVIH
jgi:hypothetical protein